MTAEGGLNVRFDTHPKRTLISHNPKKTINPAMLILRYLILFFFLFSINRDTFLFLPFFIKGCRKAKSPAAVSFKLIIRINPWKVLFPLR